MYSLWNREPRSLQTPFSGFSLKLIKRLQFTHIIILVLAAIYRYMGHSIIPILEIIFPLPMLLLYGPCCQGNRGGSVGIRGVNLLNAVNRRHQMHIPLVEVNSDS